MSKTASKKWFYSNDWVVGGNLYRVKSHHGWYVMVECVEAEFGDSGGEHDVTLDDFRSHYTPVRLVETGRVSL